MRKRELIVILLFLLVALPFLYFFPALLGFVTYDQGGAGTDFCGASVTEDSDISADHSCDGFSPSGDTNGGILATDGISLDCAFFNIAGDNTGAFGIKITGSNIVVRRCDNTNGFVSDLNVSGHDALIVDSVFADTSTNHIWVNQSVNVTLLNNTFTDGKVAVEGGGNAFIQRYVVVNVTDSDSAAVSGATVEIFNESSYGSDLTGTTDASGFVYFNVTDFWKDDAEANTDFYYQINATSGSDFGENFSVSLADVEGLYYIHVNISESDTSPPDVNITGPVSGDFGEADVSVSLVLNEAGYCEYSVNSGGTNGTLTSGVGDTEFTGIASNLANGDYVLVAYCNDTLGNRNYTESVSFSVSVGTGGDDTGGGGGGNPCVFKNWTCEFWSLCSDGFQNQSCVSNCNIKNSTIRACSCNNECEVIGSTCIGDSIQVCEFVDGCNKIVNVEACGEGTECNSGVCVVANLSPVLEEDFLDISGFLEDFLPRNWISHPGVPDLVVDIGVVVVIGGIAWIGWLWLLSGIPLLFRRLRHYSVSVFDEKNRLGIFSKGKVSKRKIYDVLEDLQDTYGPLVLAENKLGIAKYLMEEGFLEVKVGKPFSLVGHFYKSREARKFETSLRRSLDGNGGEKIKIVVNSEKMNNWKAIKAHLKEKKAKKVLRSLRK